MSGSEVRQRRRSRCRRARRPSSPAARASSSRGRMPAENTMMSVSSAVPSANSRRCRAASPGTMAFVFLPVCTRTPSASIFLRSMRAAAVVDLHAPSGAARTRPRGSRARGRCSAFAASRPSRPAADHRADLRAAAQPRGSLRDPRSCGRRNSPGGRAPAPAARTDRSRSRAPACRRRACRRPRA